MWVPHQRPSGPEQKPFSSTGQALQTASPRACAGNNHTQQKTTMLGVVSLVWRQVMSWSWSALLVAFMVVGGLLALPVVAKHSRARRLKLSAGRGGIRFEYEGEPPAPQPDDRQDDDPA